MNHLSEEELVLYYYGEEAGGAAARHLAGCADCREAHAALERVLQPLDAVPTPEPRPEYGAEVWRQIEHRLPARQQAVFDRPPFRVPALRWAIAGVALAGLLVAAFLAGRFYPRPASQPAPMAALDPQASERVLLVAVGDYLERSQMVLIELANANPQGKLDISAERERAAGLVSESRLYRQTAARAGDRAVASVLDDLDRVLLDVSHSPAQLSAEDLEKLRSRLTAEGILFKIRVLGSNARHREDAESAPPATGHKS
jgi:hypothetical protein